MKVMRGLSMMICGDCMSRSAFLSEKQRSRSASVQEPVEETIQLCLSPHNTNLGNRRVLRRY